MPLTASALAALRHIIWGPRKRLLSFRLDGDGMKRLSEASEAYLLTRLERGFRTLDYYKSITYKPMVEWPLHEIEEKYDDTVV